MKTLATPIIEATLGNPAYQPAPGAKQTYDQISPRRLGRFLVAKADLMKGLEDGKIFNVAFQDAKREAIDGVCEALGPWTSVWSKEADIRNSSIARDAYTDVSSYGSFNQFTGRVKRLEKWLKIWTKFPDPSLRPSKALIAATNNVMAIYREAAQFQEVLNLLKPLVVKGRRPAENPVEVDLTNTGICPICRGRFKLSGDVMVEHGFKISNGQGDYFGYRVGSCFGVRHPAYELSNAGNVAYKPVLASQEANAQAYLGRLTAGEVTEFRTTEERAIKGTWRYETVEVLIVKGDGRYDSYLRNVISSIENELRYLSLSIEQNDAKIKDWVPQPLKYGRK